MKGMYKLISIVLVLCILSTMLFVNAESADNPPPFDDISPDDYYYQAVIWAYENGYTSGTGNRKFSPDEGCTRGQMVTFLWRMSGSPAPTITETPFIDLKPNKFYYNAVLWAYESGLTAGTSLNTFSPDATLTRGQTVTFIFRYANGEKVDIDCPFTDIESHKYYYHPVLWAYANGITAGTSHNTFSPDDTCTRSQIVAFLWRADQFMHRCDHEYVERAIPATCEEAGKTYNECVKCGDIQNEFSTPPLGHDFRTYSVAPTCTQNGISYDVCLRCGLKQNFRSIGATGHMYAVSIVNPTCTEYGYTKYTCSGCGDTYVDGYVPALGHDMVNTVVEPTCTERGYTCSACSRCDYEVGEHDYVPALGHDYDAVVTDPTCTGQGYTTHTCSRCGDSYVDNLTPPRGHHYVGVVTNPTCTTGGYTTFTCDSCGRTYRSSFTPPQGHDYVLTSETPATCIQLATKTETCSRCGDVRTTEYGDYGPHSPVTVVVTEPTETTPGLERDICEVCQAILAEREIPATGTHTHTWVKFLVESNMNNNTNFPFVFPTGENGGSLAVQYGDWYVYYCSQCKHLYYDYYMTEPNHEYTRFGMIRCDYRKTNDEAEIEMQALVNDLRQANGKSRLSLDPICQAIARRRAIETYWNNDHSGRDPRTCENIGGGPNVAHDFTGLCNSSGHRTTMLYSYLEYMGYGIYYTGFLPCFGSVQVFSDWASLYDE